MRGLLTVRLVKIITITITITIIIIVIIIIYCILIRRDTSFCEFIP